MRSSARLFRACNATLGSFFAIVILWAVIEAASGHHLPPGPARIAAFCAIAAVSLGIGVAAFLLCGQQTPKVVAPVQEPLTATPLARLPGEAPAKPLRTARQANEGLEAALTLLVASNPQLAGNFTKHQAEIKRREEAQAADAASAVAETVTVVLRRQIPPRLGETPRSWLGGLPMLPEEVAWPRSVSSEYPERGERPLHFVAQICCEDLPADLWAGLGPRQGWLLLFIDPNQGSPEEADAFRIIHTASLGHERAPPADLGPVHDGVHTAWNFSHYGGQDFVPRIWRRWPVDLAAMPNRAEIEGRGVRVAPPDLAAQIYDGAPVAKPGARPALPAPFTRLGAIYTLNTMLSKHGEPKAPEALPDKLLAGLETPGCLEQMRVYFEYHRDKFRRRLDELRDDVGGPALEREVARRDELLAFLASHPTPASMLDHFQGEQQRLYAWRAETRARLTRLRDNLQQGDADEAFTPAEWTALQAEAAGEPYRDIGFQLWDVTARTSDCVTPPVGLIHHEQHIKLEPGHGMIELVADYYVDAARQRLIPGHVLAEFEPFWRRACNVRPHRIGGYHDGVQSEAVIGPAAHLLMFQIASDDAMQWCWGDLGAYYVRMRPAELQSGEFGRASIVLECH
jgi:uncharacterized protein YwqG